MPSTAETRPANRTNSPHQAGPPPNTSNTMRSSPYTAVFSITADISAEIWLGAAGCARGSQMCKGTMPALAPKPTSSITNIRLRSQSGIAPAMVRKSLKANVPVNRYSAKKDNVMNKVATWVITT